MQTEQDLEKLVHTYTAPLLRYCTAMLGSEADAQDAVQTTFVKAWLRRDNLRGDGQDNERAWLYRIAYRTALDMLRSAKRAEQRQPPEPPPPDPGISEELRAALNTLAPLDRALVLERVLDGMDYQMAPDLLSARRKDKLDNGYTVELITETMLATIDRPAGTTDTQHRIYFSQSSGYTWDVEEYTTPSGIVALLPRCTSNKSPALSSYAYFEQDGIYYTLFLHPGEGWGPDTRDKAEEARTMLKEVLDNFTPAA